ncbi:putative portal protein [Rhizobium phage RHph_N3_19]|nr:putative portal protein [Rhizobium phage RHph_N3_19]
MASFLDDMPLNNDLTVETSTDPGSAVAVPEASDVPNDDRKYSRLVETIREDFSRSERKRYIDEQRWLECFRNYRGLYGPTTQFSSNEKSKAFIKITKTKVMAAVAQITDVLFAGNRFPIGIQPQNLPIGAEDQVHFDPTGQSQVQAPANKTQNPQMAPHIAKRFGPKQALLEPIKDDVKSGPGQLPTDVTFEPANDAAKKMEKKILDQLDEANASKSLRSVVFELALFGSGVYKGPFAIDKEYPRWGADGKYDPEIRTIPFVEYVSIWDAYPDCDARSMAEAEKFIQRHRLSKSELRALKKRPYFRGKNIEALISEGPNYSQKYWETALIQQTQNQMNVHDRWEVLEYWGVMDAEVAKENNIKIPKEFKNHDQIQINAWISGGHVLRLVFNPFTPARIPYHVVPYEQNPYSFFGVGVAENMLDTQLLMNGFMRLAVDNAALSSNVILEVNEDYLVPGQSMELFPGKIFRRSGGPTGQAINSVKIDNHTQDALFAFDKARQLSDEATGMPSYAHGQTGVSGTTRTASGMSMLMSAAAQNIKAVVRNIDDYLLMPLGKALFAFNMQFNFEEDYIGGLEVVAKGTESLMRNEIRSQRLLQLAQFAAPNPSMAPLIKWDYILREYAASLDLDEEKVINDPRAAAVQATLMRKMAELSGQPPQNPNDQGAQGGVPSPTPSPENSTGQGAGNIAPGNSPEPGAEGFSG